MLPIIRKVHKWLALMVALQVLIWTVTGILFGFVDSNKSSGRVTRDYVAEREYYQSTASLEQVQLLTNTELSSRILTLFPDQTIETVSLTLFNQIWYYQVATPSGKYYLDAVTGRLLNIDENLARELISASYKGEGSIKSLSLDSVSRTREVSQQAAKQPQQAIWQAIFDDAINTTVLLSANTGKIIRHRNDETEFVDLLKILHFMDYQQTHHFDHWWIIAFAVASLFLSISGIVWLIDVAKRSWKRRTKMKDQQTLNNV